MKQISMFLDKATLEYVIRHIKTCYVDNAQGRVMRQVAEVIVEDLEGQR